MTKTRIKRMRYPRYGLAIVVILSMKEYASMVNLGVCYVCMCMCDIMGHMFHQTFDLIRAWNLMPLWMCYRYFY